MLCLSRNAVARPCPLLWLRALGVPWLAFGGIFVFFFFAQRCSRISGVLGEGGGAAIEGCMGQMRQRIEK